ISMRVCEACLDKLDDPSVEDSQAWLLLAACTLFLDRSPLARVLAEETSPRQVTETERNFHAWAEGAQLAEEPRGFVQRILSDTEARGEFGDAALLRAT